MRWMNARRCTPILACVFVLGCADNGRSGNGISEVMIRPEYDEIESPAECDNCRPLTSIERGQLQGAIQVMTYTGGGMCQSARQWIVQMSQQRELAVGIHLSGSSLI